MHRFSRIRAQAACVGAMLVTSAGCYRQVPLGLDRPANEARIVATLTDIGSDQMAQAIGVAAYEVEGLVESANDSTWRLRMRRVEQRGGVSTLWNSEIVSFPRSTLTNVRVREIDKRKSWLAAAAFAATSFVLQRIASGAWNVEEPMRGPPVAPPQ